VADLADAGFEGTQGSASDRGAFLVGHQHRAGLTAHLGRRNQVRLVKSLGEAVVDLGGKRGEAAARIGPRGVGDLDGDSAPSPRWRDASHCSGRMIRLARVRR
jgi:hypothetical protein